MPFFEKKEQFPTILFLLAAMLENERQRIEQLTAGWDDPTQVDWGTDETSAVEDNSSDLQRESIVSSSSLLKCTALYSYTVIFIQLFTYSLFEFYMWLVEES